MNKVATHPECIGDYLKGYARKSERLEELQLALESMGHERWQELAQLRLDMRHTSVLDVMNNHELEAIANGQVPLLAMVNKLRSEQASTAAGTSVKAVEVDPGILETLEVIALLKLGHTLEEQGGDRLDFFEVSTHGLKAALLSAFMAGMQTATA